MQSINRIYALYLSNTVSPFLSGGMKNTQSWHGSLQELSEEDRLSLVVSLCYKLIPSVPEDTLCLC